MPDDIDDETAIALAMAFSEKEREHVSVKPETRRCAWKGGIEHRMPASWKSSSGWKSAARHEGTKGRRSPWVAG
jgi:hypothetical protein